MNSVEQDPLYQELSKKIHPQDLEVLKQILITHEFDLSPTHGYFDKNDFDQISKRSLAELFQALNAYDLNHLDGEEIRFSWSQVLNQFQRNYWGFKKYQEKPTMYREPKKLNISLIPSSELPPKPTKKISYKDAFFYIWSVLQAMIITKALILVFGNELAKDDSLENRIIFAAVMIFSFGSLFLFAWIRRKNPK